MNLQTEFLRSRRLAIGRLTSWAHHSKMITNSIVTLAHKKVIPWTVEHYSDCAPAFANKETPCQKLSCRDRGLISFILFLCRKSYAALRELRLSIIPVKQHDKASRVRIFVTPLFVILCILFQLELEHLQFSFLSNYSLSLFASHNINYLYSLVKSIFKIIFGAQLQRRLCCN